MHRVRIMFIQANRNVTRAKQNKQKNVFTYTCILLGKMFAIHFAKVYPTSYLAAEFIATSGDTMIAEQKARQRYGAY